MKKNYLRIALILFVSSMLWLNPLLGGAFYAGVALKTAASTLANLSGTRNAPEDLRTAVPQDEKTQIFTAPLPVTDADYETLPGIDTTLVETLAGLGCNPLIDPHSDSAVPYADKFGIPEVNYTKGFQTQTRQFAIVEGDCDHTPIRMLIVHRVDNTDYVALISTKGEVMGTLKSPQFTTVNSDKMLQRIYNDILAEINFWNSGLGKMLLKAQLQHEQPTAAAKTPIGR